MKMNYNFTNILFLNMMFFSTIFSISSLSMINMWMGMEVNLISFIPLMINFNNKLSSESIMSYFVIQSLSSANFLFGVIFLILFNKWYMNNFIVFNNLLIFLMINISLLMKMGAAPFHFWFPKVMKGLNWQNCFILSTWQKIIPMITLSNCFLNKMMMISIILSAMIGSMMGLNQTSLMLLMSYSSISHISWMLCSLMIKLNLWTIYFSVYSFINFILMMTFNYLKLYQINQIYSNKSMNIMINYSIFMNLISLGGLPPFLGFMPKWLMINFLIINKFYMITLILMMSSLMNLFFYLKISYSFFMMNFFEIKHNKIFMSNNFIILLFSFFSMFGLILINFIPI
uniref:NADH-ubiquinone oxidoreductase chain 2 n=1 Tax=Thremma gallicum TaxID=1586284 RepID=A0A0U1Z8D0_9NEOP|nr:NADH dehydrogenase subunit 2 [Thremma gallicum]